MGRGENTPSRQVFPQKKKLAKVEDQTIENEQLVSVVRK